MHIWCAPTWRFHTELCKFLRNISTNICGLGKRTDLKLGEVSCLFISNKITISWLYPLDSFRLIFFIAWQWKRSILAIYSGIMTLCVDRHNEDYQVTGYSVTSATNDTWKNSYETLLWVAVGQFAKNLLGWLGLELPRVPVIYHSSLGMYAQKALVKYLLLRVTILAQSNYSWLHLLDLSRSYIKLKLLL